MKRRVVDQEAVEKRAVEADQPVARRQVGEGEAEAERGAFGG